MQKAICSGCNHYRRMHKIRKGICPPCVQVRDVAHRCLMARKRLSYAGR